MKEDIEFVLALTTEELKLLSTLIATAHSLISRNKTFNEISDVLRQIVELPSYQPNIRVESNLLSNIREGKIDNGGHAYVGSLS